MEHWQKEPAHRGKTPPPIAELRRDVVTTPSVSPGATRLLKHVDEAARRAFLADYDKQLDALRDTLETRRQDRLTWLKTWDASGGPHTLSAAWDTYDLDDEDDWRLFELSFARTIAALGISDSASAKIQAKPTGAQAGELDLIDTWVKAELDKSLIYLALAGHPPLQKAAEKVGSNSPLEHAPDRSGAALDGVGNAIDEIYRLFSFTLATDEIVHSLTVYLVTKPTNWRGAVADNIDAFIARLLGNNDAKTAIKALMARYGAHVTTRTTTLSQYTQWFVDAAGDPPGLSKTIDSIAKAGNLRADGYTSYELRETTTNRRAVAGKGQPNPFRGWGTVGVSAFAGVLYLVNLKMAVANFNVEQLGQTGTNLAAAIAAVGSGVNAGLMAFQTATPRTLNGMYRRAPFIKPLGGLYALRLFGYGGAFLTGATLGIQGSKLIGKGDTDAGLLYASSAITATAGGSALTYATAAMAGGGATALLTPIGWLVVGIVLVGGSIYLSIAGEDAKDGPLEQWLDASSFGKQELPDTTPYPTLKDEMDALGLAMYAPSLIESDWSDRWGFPHYLAEATIFLPEYTPGKSKVRVYANGAIIGHHPEPPGHDGTITRIKHYMEKDEGVKTVELQISYWPTPSFDKPFTLTITVPERQTPQASNEQTLPGP